MSEQPQILPENTPVIHLIYGSADLPRPDQATSAVRMASVDERHSPSDFQINWDIQNADKILGKIRYDDHEIRAAGLPYPLPQAVVDRTIHVTHWQPQVKAALRLHRAQVSLVYTGSNPDPVEKMIALYTAAHSLANEDLLGVVNEQAWTAHPRADFLDPKKINTYHDELPFILWVGYVKFFIDKQHYWLGTKGHHIFDVPDLAYFVQPGDDADQVTNQFINLFYYMYEKDVVVTAGDTVAISSAGATLRLTDVPEDAEFLMGPSGTLVVEKISPDEINP